MYFCRMYTLFAKSLPLDVASRVWDMFCRDGEEFLFRTALGKSQMKGFFSWSLMYWDLGFICSCLLPFCLAFLLPLCVLNCLLTVVDDVALWKV